MSFLKWYFKNFKPRIQAPQGSDSGILAQPLWPGQGLDNGASRFLPLHEDWGLEPICLGFVHLKGYRVLFLFHVDC